GKVEVENSHLGSIRIGFGNVQAHDRKYRRAIWDNTGEIIFHGSAHLSVASKIVCSGRLELGQDFMLNGDSTIIANKNIQIGNNCLISWNVQIMDTDFHPIYSLDNERLNPDKEIIICDHCWIGSRSNLLKGTKLSEGTIVAMGSTVTKECSVPNVVICDNKILKYNVVWQYE
ncbi:MAG: acyltransferase, partial [Lachnospiraceae bacterium]|nr:acyltransferase [Lachnospiraceae bacterium]